MRSIVPLVIGLWVMLHVLNSNDYLPPVRHRELMVKSYALGFGAGLLAILLIALLA